jgi:uncharacterized membrane protein
MWNNVLALILGGIWMIVAYYLAGVIIMNFVTNVALWQAVILSAAEISGNISQVVADVILAIPLGKALKKANVIRK